MAKFQADIADTPEEREIGLMYVEHLAEGEGMLFVYDDEETRTFWMKNTCIPLDILFISADGIIVDIARETEPMSRKPVTSKRPASFALEVKGGTAEELGIAVGGRVLFAD
ncbi:MAG: DUF192 domain-containing protein [Kiritimatiellia bacterium]